FRDRLCREVTVDHFATPEELEARVTAALSLEFGAGPAPVERPAREVPPLLPYQCNRAGQEFQLAEAIQSHRDKADNRPWVCGAHGAEAQCHEESLERPGRLPFPRLLGPDRDRAAIKTYLIDSPSIARNADDYRRRLRSALADRVLDRPTATAEEIAAAL